LEVFLFKFHVQKDKENMEKKSILLHMQRVWT
jgi:hypothetical protein